MPRLAPSMSPLAIVAVTLSSICAAVGLVVAGAVWFVFSILFSPSNPQEPSRSVVSRGLEYHEDSRKISGMLERHYEWNSSTPIDVTLTAYTPNGPADGVRVTIQRVVPSSASFIIDLTNDQAAAFGHPDARRTVSLRGADGRLVQEETAWPK